MRSLRWPCGWRGGLATGLASLLLLASACGVDEAPAAHGVLVHLDLRPERALDLPTATAVVQHFDLIGDSALWSAEAPMIRLVPRASALAQVQATEEEGAGTAESASAEGLPRELLLRARRADQVVRITRRAPLDLGSFQQIAVPLRFDGQGELLAVFLRDGVEVGRTESVPLTPVDELATTGVLGRPTLLELPPELHAAGVVDTLQLECTGIYRMLLLSEVSLLTVPPASLLPLPGAGPLLVRSGQVSRRAFGLLAPLPLVARAEVPAGAVLELAFAQPAEALRSLGPAELVLSVDGEPAGRWPLLPRPAPDEGWHAARVDLARWAGQEVRLAFRLDVAPDTPAAAREVSPPSGPHDAPAAGLGERPLVGCALAQPLLFTPEATAPCVLLVTSDTHRADHVGFAGDEAAIATPALDALAARGLVFEDCFAPINVTNPSHAALMTAASARVTGVRSNFSRLSDAAPTLAEAFAGAGFRTFAALSTRHLGDDHSGLGQGFERVSWPRAQSQRGAAATIDEVLGWLPDADGAPLFLWVHVFDAHWPYEPPAAWAEHYYGQSDPRDPALPEPALPLASLKPELDGVRDPAWPRAMYKAEISALDEQLARLFAAGRIQAGVVAVVADHGESLGEHGIFYDHLGLYPSVLHVPLVLAGPGVPVGAREGRPVMHTDLGRTLLDLGGLQHVVFPGNDLLALPAPAPRFALEGYGASASVTHEGMHLVLTLTDSRPKQVLVRREKHEVELYDLRRDPGCIRNLVNGRPDVARTLRAALVRWLEEPVGRSWSEARQDDAAFLTTLQQLGYVATGEAVDTALWEPDDCAWCQRFR